MRRSPDRRCNWPAMPPIADIDLRTLDPVLLKARANTSDDEHAGQQQLRGRRRARGWRRARRERHAPRPARAGTLVSRARRSIRIRAARDARSTSIGASLPGTPAIVAGSNRDVAWGFTNSYADTTDWVRVERDADDPDHYRTAHGDATFVQARRNHPRARRAPTKSSRSKTPNGVRSSARTPTARRSRSPGSRSSPARSISSCSNSSSPRRSTKPSRSRRRRGVAAAELRRRRQATATSRGRSPDACRSASATTIPRCRRTGRTPASAGTAGSMRATIR